MNTVLEKPKADWVQAKMAYVQDVTLTYADIAEMFGVSTRQVERRGKDEDWGGCRQDVGQNVEYIITAKMVDERVAINDKHQQQYAAVQAYIRVYMATINKWNKKIIDEAQAKGETPNPDDFYSPKKLRSLMKTLRLAIEGERVTVDLPNIIVAPVGWQPPELSDKV
ncbi:hypothetical protein EPO05_06715 [Patescibacteria group bacterium]|nr:MAG: hypothetical protein EPO05_06715 [Patescibacteria group bacterium]